MADERGKLLREVASLLAYHKSIGICTYPRNKDIDHFCKTKNLHNFHLERKKSKNVSVYSKDQGGEEPKKKRGIKSEGDLADLSLEIAACEKCDLHKERVFSVPGKGVAGANVLVVGDWLSVDTGEEALEGMIMGVEQDQMLFRMFDAIKLEQDDVFISNVIKCAVPGNCHPAAAHVHKCLPFLRRQIALLRPKMICTMGMIAARSILGQSRSLSQLRGKLHIYESEEGLRIPVVATYHPTYLLQNPEMKKAAWVDLQFLAKRV